MLARRRAVRATVVALTFGGVSVLGFAAACGVDLAGSLPEVVPAIDAGVDVRAMPPPRGDSSPPPIDATVDAPAPPSCPGTLGAMVMVDAGGLFFCIDGTEVTNGAYDAFLAATDGGAPAALDAGVPDACAANTTFARVGPGPDPATLPAARIDWCDARAFCAWAGKRLCGKVVKGDASTSEWLVACTNGGQRTHPYGNGYEAGVCNEDSVGVAVPQAVGTAPECQGGVPGLFDMNGNIAEMIDDCKAGSCAAVGGYYYEPSPSCAVVQDVARTKTAAELGFRCCADPQ